MNSALRILGRPHNFLGLEPAYSEWTASRAVVIPAPLETSTSYGRGTAAGPAAILRASHQVEFYDEELDAEPCRRGIATVEGPALEGVDTAAGVTRVRDVVAAVLAVRKLPIILGGEHSLTEGVVAALAAQAGAFTILQLDAHSDLREEYEGNPRSHACAMRRCLDHVPHLVMVGIRSQSVEEARFIRERSLPVFYAHHLHTRSGWDAIFEHLLPNVYLTIDCDFFDPALLPAVGTPEPNGFGWQETLSFLRTVIRRRTLVGLDVVELAPVPGQPASDFLVARLVYKLIGALYALDHD